MTAFAVNPEDLKTGLEAALGDKAKKISVALGEVSVVVAPADYLAVATILRDHPALQFELLVDLCGVDYSTYKDIGSEAFGGNRYGIVSHLLSVSLNQRVRLKVFAADDDVPVVASLCGLSARPLTCLASSLKATLTCAAS
jgi:NADH-quinone oxidoreductase subunit C